MRARAPTCGTGREGRTDAMLRARVDAHGAAERRARGRTGRARGPGWPTPAPATLLRMRRTKIVATIGPASRDPETLSRMVEAGMDVARVNYSHGTLEEHAETVARVRNAAGQAGRAVAILQDLPGPKLRIGPLKEDIVELTPGERLTFVCGDHDVQGDAHRMSISWAGLPDAIEPGAVMYLADGSVQLR